jgi:hypothetical protein
MAGGWREVAAMNHTPLPDCQCPGCTFYREAQENFVLFKFGLLVRRWLNCLETIAIGEMCGTKSGIVIEAERQEEILSPAVAEAFLEYQPLNLVVH